MAGLEVDEDGGWTGRAWVGVSPDLAKRRSMDSRPRQMPDVLRRRMTARLQLMGNGFAIPKEQQEKVVKFSFHGQPAELRRGSVVITAITSCTNTSNPSVILVANKTCELGLEFDDYLTDKAMGKNKSCPRFWCCDEIFTPEWLAKVPEQARL